MLVGCVVWSPGIVHHYGATRARLRGTPLEFARAVQRHYVGARGYSVGYSFLTWPDGTVVELRGWRYRNAANAVDDDGGLWNRTTLAVLHASPGEVFDAAGYAIDPLTPAQLAATVELAELVAEVCGRPIGSTLHQLLEPTGCPGAGIVTQWRAGRLDPQPLRKDDPVFLLGYFTGSTWEREPIVWSPLGWRRLRPEEPGELVWLSAARYNPDDGQPVKFPGEWRTKYPEVRA